MFRIGPSPKRTRSSGSISASASGATRGASSLTGVLPAAMVQVLREEARFPQTRDAGALSLRPRLPQALRARGRPLSADFEELASGYGLVEGPTWAPDGSLYWSDVLGGGVYRPTPGGAIEPVVPTPRRLGGIARRAPAAL